MSFHRTTSGLSNQYLFYNVDAIVYTEGGKISYSLADIKNDQYNDKSTDIIFWRKLFSTYQSTLKLKYKAVGSKTTVHSIAKEVLDNDIKSVIAVMDNEFDDLHGKLIEHPHIIYTRGYSWENDVWSIDLIISILEDLYGGKIDQNLINESFSAFAKEIEDCVYADAFLFANNDSFFPRPKHLDCLNLDFKSTPTVNVGFVNQLFTFRKLDRAKVKHLVVYNLDAISKCYGHLVNDYVYHTIRYISTKVLEIKLINRELLEAMAISRFLDFCSKEIGDYYYANINGIKII